MGAYAAVASHPVLPESVQDVSSNSKYERTTTTKGTAAMGTIKVSSTVEYVLFPTERHFRHLREDGAGEEESRGTDLNETIKRGWGGGEMRGRKDRRHRQETNR